MLGLALVAALVLFALLGPVLIGADPNQSDFSLGRDAFGAPPGPSAAHPLGTDPVLRDLLARLAHGARLSLLVGACATALALCVGTAVGLGAGYLEGSPRRYRLRLGPLRLGLPVAAVDSALMRLVDVALAFPFLLLVTAIGVAIERADALTVVLVLGLTGWTGIARVVRAKTMQVVRLDYVSAATALGASHARILWRHVLPALLPTLLVIGTQAVASMILAEAVLSYLTVGLQPPQATWGRMLHEAEGYLGVRFALVAAPGLAIMLAVLGFARVGDGLRDALLAQDAPRRPPAPGRLPADLLIAAAALVLVGFASPGRVGPPRGRPAAPGAAPVRGGWLRVATSQNIRALDPALAYDEASSAIGQLLFARLLRWDEQGRLVPDLAESHEARDGGRIHRFRLRPGLRFHDGAPLDAADVKRSLERLLAPGTPSPGASQYAMIVGHGAYRGGKAASLAGVRVLGPAEIEIELGQPDATFLPLLAMGFAAPVCPSSGRQVETKRPARPCGAGPFRLEAWDPGERVVLRRFDGYHVPGMPYLDGIVWYTQVPARTQRYRFESGELDYLRELSVADTAMFEADPRWKLRGRWAQPHSTFGVFLNTEMPPFADRHVRRAVAFALDPSVLGKVRPNVGPTDRMIPASLPGPERLRPMRRHDPAAALAELALAGYAYDPRSGRGGYPEPIDFVTVPDTFDQHAAEIFQQQLAKVGIRIRLRLLSYAAYLAETQRRRRCPMGWTAWGADFPDPSNFFEPILTSGAIREEGSQNIAFFSHAELDAVVSRAQHEQDRTRRMALYERAEEIVRDEAPWIPLYATRYLELWHPYVMGYEPHPILPMKFDRIWMAGAPGAEP
ncbi:MAG: ABC transporter permease subunit [Deltaproteobacteria bacterium]|nr:ABC transporter permease subunit [Deltaproteobacteria bacterium]